MLYGHSQNLTAAMPLIERIRPPVWVWIGNSNESDLFNASYCGVLGIKLVVRHAGMDGVDWKAESILDPYGLAQRYVNDCKAQPYWHAAWAFTSPNEPVPIPETPLEYLVFLSECVRLFEAAGKQCIVGNFGTGQGVPPVVPGARHYGVHWYFGSEMLWADSLMALSRDLPQDAQIWVTEAGFTAALGTDVPPGQDNAYGWRGRVAAEDYATWLVNRNSDAVRILGNRYRGMAVFQAGADPDWSQFQVLDSPIEWVLWPLRIAATTGTPIATATLPGYPVVTAYQGGSDARMPEYVLGFKELAERLGADVVGDPQINQDTLHNPDGADVLTVQTTTKGVMFYQPGASPVFLPART